MIKIYTEATTHKCSLSIMGERKIYKDYERSIKMLSLFERELGGGGRGADACVLCPVNREGDKWQTDREREGGVRENWEKQRRSYLPTRWRPLRSTGLMRPDDERLYRHRLAITVPLPPTPLLCHPYFTIKNGLVSQRVICLPAVFQCFICNSVMCLLNSHRSTATGR